MATAVFTVPSSEIKAVGEAMLAALAAEGELFHRLSDRFGEDRALDLMEKLDLQPLWDAIDAELAERVGRRRAA